MNQPASSIPEAAQSTEHPLTWKALPKLFFSPSEYFRSIPLDSGPAWLLVAWISGICSVIDRVDQRLLRADVKGGASGMDAIAGSWQNFWALALSAGVLWACWNWWVGGWWYRMRLVWSGASGTNPRQTRLVHMFAGFVLSMPTLVYTIAQSILYPNYRAAWNADSAWSFLLIVFLLWSIVVSWRAVLTCFPVRPTRALWWFLILPITVYCLLFGVVGALLAFSETG